MRKPILIVLCLISLCLVLSGSTGKVGAIAFVGDKLTFLNTDTPIVWATGYGRTTPLVGFEMCDGNTCNDVRQNFYPITVFAGFDNPDELKQIIDQSRYCIIDINNEANCGQGINYQDILSWFTQNTKKIIEYDGGNIEPGIAGDDQGRTMTILVLSNGNFLVIGLKEILLITTFVLIVLTLLIFVLIKRNKKVQRSLPK